MREIILTPAGADVPLKVWRDGKVLDLDVLVADWPKLEEPEGAMTSSMASAAQAQSPDFGLILAPLTGASRRFYKITSTKGVVVAAVDPTSEAFSCGISPGDVILEIQGKPVSSPEEVSRAVETSKGKEQFIDLLVAGKESTRWVALYSGHTQASNGAKVVAAGSRRSAAATETAGSHQPDSQTACRKLILRRPAMRPRFCEAMNARLEGVRWNALMAVRVIPDSRSEFHRGF